MLGLSGAHVYKIRIKNNIVAEKVEPRAWVESEASKTRRRLKREKKALLRIQWLAFNRERIAINKFDERSHWINHPAWVNFRALKTPSYKKTLAETAERLAKRPKRNCFVCHSPSDHKKFCSNKCERNYRSATRTPEQKQRRRDYVRTHDRLKLATDPNYKLKQQLKSRIHKALRAQNVTKRNRTIELCGCSPDFLRGWLEQQFTAGMTWENQGEFWHIDHEIPVAAFDLRDPEQQRRCFHYSNLRALAAFDNMSKSDKIIPTQPELTLPFHPVLLK
jgi:hypothetical protein